MTTATLNLTDLRRQLLALAAEMSEANPDGMNQKNINKILDAADLVGSMDDETEGEDE